MTFLTIDYIRAHSRLCCNLEEELLTLYAGGAEETLAGLLGRGDTVDEMVASLTEQYGKVPDAIKQAGLMLVDLGYMQRNPVSPQNYSVVPYAIDLLIKNFILL